MVAIKKLGQALLAAGLINDAQLENALDRQKAWGGRLGKHLTLIGALTEDQLMSFIAGRLGIEEIDLTDIFIPQRILKLVPQKVADQFHLLPIRRAPKNGLVVACADPTDLEGLDQVSFVTGHKVIPQVASYSMIQEAINRHYLNLTVSKNVLEQPSVNQSTRNEIPVASEHHSGVADPEIVLFGEPKPRPAEPAPGPKTSSDPMAEALFQGGLLPDERDNLIALYRILIRRGLVTQEEIRAELAAMRKEFK